MIKIKLIYVDYWGRPTYQTEEGDLLKDVNLGDMPIHLTTVASNRLEGEPIGSISHSKRYKGKSIKIVEKLSRGGSVEDYEYLKKIERRKNDRLAGISKKQKENICESKNNH